MLCVLCGSLALPLAQGEPAGKGQKQTASDNSAWAFGVLSDQIQQRMGFKIVLNANEDVCISSVLPSTPASISGLKVGDRIIDAQLADDALIITIERGKNIFDARLSDKKIPDKTKAHKEPVLIMQQAKLGSMPSRSFNLKLEQIATMPDNQLIPEKAQTGVLKRQVSDANTFALSVKKNQRLLASYDMQLIVDRSSSMHKDDCPGGLSRWDWVGQQAGEIVNAILPYNPNGITIIPFATEYDVFEHASPQDVDYLFKNIGLQGGTRLYEPLTERLDNFFAHYKPGSKPLLLVVITDGCPAPRFEPPLVKQTLIEASKKMEYPQAVTVVFFQIGSDDRFGQRFLTELDEDLVEEGARYHFVHCLLFDQFQDVGLGPALVQTLKQYAPQPESQPSATTKAPSSGGPKKQTRGAGNSNPQKSSASHKQ